MSNRWLAALNCTTLVGLWVYSLLVYSRLPDRIPLRFDLWGNATAWGPKPHFLEIPLIFSGIVVLVLALSTLTLHEARLAWLNLPHKERLLRLPPAARREALSVVWGFVWAALVAVLPMAWLLVWMVARHAHNAPPPGGLFAALWGLDLAYLAFLIAGLGPSLRRVLERYPKEAQRTR
ncbi:MULTISPECIES: DUF1648 domain-containing protein [unclassified Meiothermus]|uniref:DUF1648 domain-containing protein n=1 Tax=unclassified Meiothermus TaxID=370471 RepID=UPI000D7C6F9E|nr:MULTISPECIES: DUF1648 domain-containing protein [unclassified Meiothermus]PZA08257.1 hypothetical protein DNA98_03720 [Meiothermus sp. Pnk-1]RYM38999.1 DUF1648 domain-containing protein [Meiothermus sp. PNK-Is4]